MRMRRLILLPIVPKVIRLDTPPLYREGAGASRDTEFGHYSGGKRLKHRTSGVITEGHDSLVIPAECLGVVLFQSSMEGSTVTLLRSESVDTLPVQSRLLK